MAAYESLCVEGRLNKQDKRISAFVKAEKFNPLLKPSKPRMIMARAPRYNLILASYLKPFEHMLYDKWRVSVPGVPKTRLVGKGLNGDQRAELIRRKMEGVGEGCVVFEVDGKSFEAHVTQEDLVLEHSVYRAAYPGDRQLSELLDTQLVLKGITSGGVVFRREGARASGDFNTGLGNTVIMGASVKAAVRVLTDELGVFRYDLLADGDNCLIFVEPRVASEVHRLFARAVRTVSGQEMAVEDPVTRLTEVVFGQSKPCKRSLGSWTMVRNPLKTLSHAFSGYRHYNHYDKFGVKILKAVAQCELALARGIPVLQAYFAAAVNKLGKFSDLRNPNDFLEARYYETLAKGGALPDVKVVEITAEARQSFFEAWGIGVDEQLDLERRLPLEMTFPHEDTEFGRVGWVPVYVGDGSDGEGITTKSWSGFLDSVT
jgi:hypothetical protein